MDSTDYSEYKRDPIVDERFGEPDFKAWSLFDHSNLKKSDALKALHIIFRTMELPIEDARKSINTYTTVAYRLGEKGFTYDATNNPNFYSENKTFGKFYSNPLSLENDEREKIKQALLSEWGKYVALTLGIGFQKVIETLRSHAKELRIELTQGAVSNGYIPIPSDQDLFGSHNFGGTNEADQASKITLHLPNGQTIQTDIRSPSGRSGRIRMRFYTLF